MSDQEPTLVFSPPLRGAIYLDRRVRIVALTWDAFGYSEEPKQAVIVDDAGKVRRVPVRYGLSDLTLPELDR